MWGVTKLPPPLPPLKPPAYPHSSLASLAQDLHMCTSLARFAACMYARVNAIGGPFLGKRLPSQILALHNHNMPKQLAKLRLRVADCVYRLQTAFTCAWAKAISGPFFGKGGPSSPKHWHFASTTCRQCLRLADRVYMWQTVSTDYSPPSRVNW